MTGEATDIVTLAVGALLERALEYVNSGQLQCAQTVCRQVLAYDSQNFNALQLLGHCALRAAHYEEAAQWLMAAHSLNPSSAQVLSNLAVALLALDRLDEALRCCDLALRQNSSMPEAWCNRGHALRLLGRSSEALTSYDRALKRAPGPQDARTGRIKALLALSKYLDASRECHQLLEADATNLEAWSLKGALSMAIREPAEALAAFTHALALSPRSAQAHNNLGTALRDLKRPAEALEAYLQAARLQPELPEAWCNAANLSLDAGDAEEALARCDQALTQRPRFIEALNLRGTALRLLERHHEAASTYERIVAIAPDHGQAQSFLLASRAALCDWRDYAKLQARIIERVRAGESASAPHAFLWISDSSALQHKCARSYSADQFPTVAFFAERSARRSQRLRIGYLSSDLTDHPVAHLIAGVLEHHDRTRFETHGFSLVRDATGSAMRSRLERAFEVMHDVSEMSDRDVALLMRGLGIDIAVDLTGHTRGGRYGILAFRPADVQINFLGFAGTSGADYMDYLIGDAVVTPVHQEKHFTEKIIRMPGCFMPNDDTQPIADETPSRRALGLPEEGFVFCAFNNAYKLNPTLFDVWMRLLGSVPGSVLWLRSTTPAAMENLRCGAESRQVSCTRLVFAPRVDDMAAHLARYRQADLFLDTLPYGAHATGRDALWAGLPVLTAAGSSFASRVAASLLLSLGLSELVTESLRDYEARATYWALNPGPLADIRRTLQGRRHSRHGFFDTLRYCRSLETAFDTAYARRERGEPATSFSCGSSQPS